MRRWASDCESSRGETPNPQRRHRVDSQSAKTTGGVGGEQRGYDGGKKVRGISRRHLLVDTEGSVLTKPRSTAQRSPTPRWANALLLKAASERFFHASLSHTHTSVGGCRLPQGRGKEWAESSTAWLKCRGSPSHTPSQYPRR
jgi:hypothetical protein